LYFLFSINLKKTFKINYVNTWGDYRVPICKMNDSKNIRDRKDEFHTKNLRRNPSVALGTNEEVNH
jgi:hypothetical protein